MAVNLDAGNVAKKSASFASKAIASGVKAAAKKVSSSVSSPFGNGAVAAKQAELNQTAKVVKLNLSNSYAAQTQTPQERADEIIKSNGGRDHLNTDNAGADIGQIALSDPAAAYEVSVLVLDDVKDNDRDEVAQSFTDSLSDDQLDAIAKEPKGKELLELHRENILDGKIHKDERASAQRLQNAVQGYPTPELTGNPAIDIKTVAADLEGLSPEKQAEYLNEVLSYPDGIQILQRAAVLDANQQAALAQGLSSAYDADPLGMGSHLKELVEAEKQYSVYEWSGFANVISQTGNDALIGSYARHSINHASANPEHNSVSVDAMQALSGMSPDALANFISFRSVNPPMSGDLHGIARAVEGNRAQFNAVLADAAGWLSPNANNNGMANPWAFNPALGNLLDTASRMTTPDGKPTTAALEIFETIATKTGDNFFTKEAAGRFFIEHSQSIVDRYAALRNADGSVNYNENPGVLKDFFIGVVYSPISHLLEYNGKPMTEVIMGNGQGDTGVIGSVAQTIMDRAANGGDPEALGRQIGSLYGAISGGFLDSVEAYKDKFNEDKEFREFMYGIVNKGLGSLGKKAGIPLDKVASFAEKLYEAGKSREKSARLKGFQEAFLILKKDMSRSLLEFENKNPQTLGIEESFTIGWNDFITTYLASDWIAN